MDTPELDKLMLVKDKLQAVSKFIEWLAVKGILLAKRHEHSWECYKMHRCNTACILPCRLRKDVICGYSDFGIQIFNHVAKNLLDEFFEVDLDKAEAERHKSLEGQDHSNDSLDYKQLWLNEEWK